MEFPSMELATIITWPERERERRREKEREKKKRKNSELCVSRNTKPVRSLTREVS